MMFAVRNCVEMIAWMQALEYFDRACGIGRIIKNWNLQSEALKGMLPYTGMKIVYSASFDLQHLCADMLMCASIFQEPVAVI